MWETILKIGLLLIVISKLKRRPMFYVKITKVGKDSGLKEQTIKMKTEKFYELIGRYTCKMGCPEEVVDPQSPIKELAFYEKPHDGFEYVTIEYVKVSKDGEMLSSRTSTVSNSTYVPLEPTEDKLIVDERLVEMANDGCFKVA
jgi:hypothetical protein